jgi:hypothetical protein
VSDLRHTRLDELRPWLTGIHGNRDNAGVDELILRTVVIQFDGRVVEVFGGTETIRQHVALMQEPKIGKPDYRGRCEIVMGHRFGVDTDEMAKLRPLLDKIAAAVRDAKAERPQRRAK